MLTFLIGDLGGHCFSPIALLLPLVVSPAVQSASVYFTWSVPLWFRGLVMLESLLFFSPFFFSIRLNERCLDSCQIPSLQIKNAKRAADIAEKHPLAAGHSAGSINGRANKKAKFGVETEVMCAVVQQ
jgi:hypothetical protein